MGLLFWFSGRVKWRAALLCACSPPFHSDRTFQKILLRTDVVSLTPQHVQSACERLSACLSVPSAEEPKWHKYTFVLSLPMIKPQDGDLLKTSCVYPLLLPSEWQRGREQRGGASGEPEHAAHRHFSGKLDAQVGNGGALTGEETVRRMSSRSSHIFRVCSLRWKRGTQEVEWELIPRFTPLWGSKGSV